MVKILRYLIGIAGIGLLLAVASWAVRDCQVALYVYENCIWLGMRDALGLPQSKLLRAVLLQGMGLGLLGGIYLTWRYVFPHRARAAGQRPDSSEASGKMEIRN